MNKRSKCLVINLGLATVLLGGFAAFEHFFGSSSGTLGEVVPEFRLPVLHGKGELGPGEWHGRALVLNFWASWCTACRAERSILSELRSVAPGALLGVAAFDSAAGAEAVEVENPHGYPVVLDASGEVATRFGIAALPQTILVGADGQVVRRYERALREADLAEIRAWAVANGRVAMDRVRDAHPGH